MAWPEEPRDLLASDIAAIPEIAQAANFRNQGGVADDPATLDRHNHASFGKFVARAAEWLLKNARGIIPDALAPWSSAVSEANAAGRPVFVAQDVESTTHLRVPAFGPGKVIVNGANSASNNETGKASVLPPVSGLTPHHPCALLRVTEFFYRGWVHLGGKTWQVVDFASDGLDAEDNPTPYNWNRTIIDEIEDLIVWGDDAVSTSGSWGGLTSTDGTAYIGHLAAQATAGGAYVEIEFNCPNDGGSIAIGFSGRTNGCFVAATIDGSTDLVNQLPEFGGNRVIDTFTPVDLTHRQRALVATNLPAKSSAYVLRLTLTTDKNPSADAGNRFLFNCAFVDMGPISRARLPRPRPRPWLPSETFGAYEECLGANGWTYVTVAGGTTGGTIPSHASGTVSDGGVSWFRIPFGVNGFVTKVTEIQGAGSRLEYAYEVTPDGQESSNDVGGMPHGNEYVTGVEVISDGAPVSLAVGEHVVGRNISLVQKIHAYYGDVSSSPIHVADTVLSHNMGGGRIVVAHETEFVVDATLGYHYPAMWPLLGYAGIHRGNVFDEMETPQGGRIRFLDYPAANPLVGRTRDFQMRAIGDIYRPVGTVTVPEEGPGEYRCIATLTISPESVGEYEHGTTQASMAPNFTTSSENVGTSSWALKMYFARSTGSLPESVAAGDKVRAVNEYHIGLFPKGAS